LHNSNFNCIHDMYMYSYNSCPVDSIKQYYVAVIIDKHYISGTAHVYIYTIPKCAPCIVALYSINNGLVVYMVVNCINE